MRSGFLVKSRATTLIAVLALALGIGANTAIFSIVNAVLFRPLPYHAPDRLMTVLSPGSAPLSPADYMDVREQASSFDRVAAAEYWSASLTGRESPEQIAGLHLSEDMFPMLGVAALRGRTFDKNDFEAGKEQVLVISHALWQRAFGGSNEAIGQQVLLDGASFTVIGVMPADFYFAPFWATGAEDVGASRSLGAAAFAERTIAARFRTFETWRDRANRAGRGRPDLP